MKWYKILSLHMILFFLAGCTASVKTHSPDEPIHYDERYDYTDLQLLSERMVSSVIANPPISQRDEAAVVIVYGIANRTSEHVDTKSLTDSIRTGLSRSGKLRFVNETQRENIEKEISQMQGRVSPENQIHLGAQVGAEYMLTGTLASIEKEEMKQVRFKRKRLLYYKLTMELTNIKTALIEWTDEQEIVREASRPFIGW